MPELKPCPFCGCSMEVRGRLMFPNGDAKIDIRGWHDENCPLDSVLWCLYPEDGWTPEKFAESWNRRWHDA